MQTRLLTLLIITVIALSFQIDAWHTQRMEFANFIKLTQERRNANRLLIQEAMGAMCELGEEIKEFRGEKK